MAKAVAIELDKSNIVDYLCRHTDLLEPGQPVEVKELFGEESEPEEEGFVNFIWRVRQNGKSFIVKQSRLYLRRAGIVDNLPTERNYMEYYSFILRDGIVKDSVPKMYFLDIVNNIFVMEDLFSKNMRLMRFQLSEGRKFINFPKQIATFIACNHFYTSELFLEKGFFRKMQIQFANLDMRAIMEDLVLMKHQRESDCLLNYLGTKFWEDPQLRLELMKVRDTLIRKGDCLIHGDLHTSNVFVDDASMRVIDMEYSFVAPYSYDLGYLLANFISQYAAFMFNSRFSREERESFQKYLLDTIREVFECYFECFQELFQGSAKQVYLETPGYLEEYLFPEILYDSLGFMAATNAYRIINLVPYPDFDALENPTDKLLAQGFSLAIDEYLLRNRRDIESPAMLIEGILNERQKYLRTIYKAAKA